MDFQTLLEKRRSVREYNSDKKVSKEEIVEIVKAVQNAPSWKNSQTARYHIVLSEDKAEKLREECLPDFNQNSTKGAAGYLVATYKKNMSGFNIHTGEAVNELGNSWGCYDLGLSNAAFILMAKEKGIDTLIMGIRDEKKIREMLEIPEEEIIASVIAFGYTDIVAEKRPRKELDEILKFY